MTKSSTFKENTKDQKFIDLEKSPRRVEMNKGRK